MTYTANRRLWLTADRSSVVEDGDPRAAFLLAAGPGDEIPLPVAERCGLLSSQAPTPAPAVEDKALRSSTARPRAARREG